MGILFFFKLGGPGGGYGLGENQDYDPIIELLGSKTEKLEDKVFDLCSWTPPPAWQNY